MKKGLAFEVTFGWGAGSEKAIVATTIGLETDAAKQQAKEVIESQEPGAEVYQVLEMNEYVFFPQ